MKITYRKRPGYRIYTYRDMARFKSPSDVPNRKWSTQHKNEYKDKNGEWHGLIWQNISLRGMLKDAREKLVLLQEHGYTAFRILGKTYGENEQTVVIVESRIS